jgi:K+-sensing histidine kinase KdpD
MVLSLAIAGMTALRAHLNLTTVGLAMVLCVISLAVTTGRGPALWGAVLAGLAFNFFFIEPYYSFRINQPQDVVAFIVFVATAVLVGQLSFRLEERVLQTQTQQKQLDRAREDYERVAADAAEAEELRRSDQLKSALLDAVTHDLRTPLTSIKAAITTVRGQKVPDPVRDELYEVIEQESDRLNRFIEGMMDLARLTAGELEFKATAVAAEEVVEDALERAGPNLSRHHVEVSVAPELPALQVDPRLISQVLFTLIENAAKYSPQGSYIHVSAEQGQQGAIRFIVADEGPGIPEELREKVFQKFFRAGKGTGYGVGLAIARGIVQAHGGRIWVESGEHAAGTSMRFEIPGGAAL